MRLARFRSESTKTAAESGYSVIGSDLLSIDPTTCQIFELDAKSSGTMEGGTILFALTMRRMK